VTWVIIITFVGFVALAAALLVPVYRLLKREERRNEEVDRRLKEKP
jgi:Flp pilus assembly protein TadB